MVTRRQMLNLSGMAVASATLSGKGQRMTAAHAVPGARRASQRNMEMSNPGVWVMGEVRKHIMSAGMGAVVEYAGCGEKPQWQQPTELVWDYLSFAASDQSSQPTEGAIAVPVVFESKFAGHGAMDHWTINGKSYPEATDPTLKAGQRYRLHFIKHSANERPVHLHRHSFELRKVPGHPETHGIVKDTVLVEATTQVEVEFPADNPGTTLFRCHQQNHMDAGFMMLLHNA
jgi:hypothetical protein